MTVSVLKRCMWTTGRMCVITVFYNDSAPADLNETIRGDESFDEGVVANGVCRSLMHTLILAIEGLLQPNSEL